MGAVPIALIVDLNMRIPTVAVAQLPTNGLLYCGMTYMLWYLRKVMIAFITIIRPGTNT